MKKLFVSLLLCAAFVLSLGLCAHAEAKIDYVTEVDHVHDVPDPITSDLSALREELARLKKRESELEMERPDNWII